MPDDPTAQLSATGQSDSEITVVAAAVPSPSSSASQTPGLDTDPPPNSTGGADTPKRISKADIMPIIHPPPETKQVHVAPALPRPVSITCSQHPPPESQPDPAPTPAPVTAPTPAPVSEPEPEPELEPEPEQPIPDSKPEELGSEAVPQMPQTSLTFLLVSGRRRTMSFEPETTIARVKELVWNAWPSEWQDERPPTPSYLRILYLGKILQDDDTLTTLSFPKHTPQPTSTAAAAAAATTRTAPAATIVHLSIRPYALPTDDDAPKKKGRRRRGSRGGDADGTGDGDADADVRGAGCCGGCVIC